MDRIRVISARRVETRFKPKPGRMSSPDILKNFELKLTPKKSEKAIGESLQFSPLQYKKNLTRAKNVIEEDKHKNPVQGSPSKLQKQISQKLFRLNTQSYKFLTPKQVSGKIKKNIRNRFEDTKNWRKVINLTNGVESTSSFFSNYLVYIGKGNNSSLVKKIILSRYWWNLTEDKDKANFVWTQWKDKNYLAGLPCLFKQHHLDQEVSVNARELPGFKLITESPSFCVLKTEKLQIDQTKMHNKLEFNNVLSNKKSLFLTMREYYAKNNLEIFSRVPLTFHISNKTLDIEYINFLEKFYDFEKIKESYSAFHNIWIVKPGEFTNRGQGISVCKDLEEINKLINSSEHTVIIQKYIENPLLIFKRKFDIRCYSLITCINGVMQGYFYLDGYLRTASYEFSLKDCSNLFVHLTNDAIQKKSKEYGRYENGNKLSYKDFQKYLNKRFPDKKINFFTDILPLIKEVVKETILASFGKIDVNKRANSIEIFGYDFMIDRQFKPWLIEVNTNPCLELSSKYLSKLIPDLLENAFKITLDSVFSPPVSEYIDLVAENRFELIFHEFTDGLKIAKD